MPAIFRFPFLIPLLFGTLSLLPSPVTGQDTESNPAPANSGSPVSTVTPPIFAAPSTAPLKLEIARRDLKNFLTDEKAAAPYRSSTGEIGVLSEVFMIGSPNVSRAFFWDPVACRLLGVLDLDAPETPAPVSAPAPLPDADATKGNEAAPEEMPPPSPYLLKASGAMPLFGSPGVSESPRYFGFRLIGGMPEFLYTAGSLAVEERLWLDEGGKVLKQRFAIPGARKGFQITLPEDWKKRATVSAGTWKENVLSVPEEAVTEIIISYRLIDLEPEPVDAN